MKDRLDDRFAAIADRIADRMPRRRLMRGLVTAVAGAFGATFLSGFRPPVPIELALAGNGCTHKADSCDADGDHCGLNGGSCNGYKGAAGCIDAATGCPKGSARSGSWRACCLCTGKTEGRYFDFLDCCTAPGGSLDAACATGSRGMPSCSNGARCPNNWCTTNPAGYICTIMTKTSTVC